VSIPIVARRYARALLELGVEQGQLEKILDDVTTVADCWQTSAELRNVLENPLVAHPTKRAVVGELADQIGACPAARDALFLLVDRRRTRMLPYLAYLLRELADARKGVLHAEVTTAVRMSDDYYARLQAQLETMTGRRVVVHAQTDESLIGGVVTRVGDRIFDGSLRTRLQSLRETLLPH
jgi:F-type H+-transporting ATPase subunit delta